ncbi:MAG TPA: hypothetical protein VF054_04285 [Micromonosporaceae bacterium]
MRTLHIQCVDDLREDLEPAAATREAAALEAAAAGEPVVTREAPAVPGDRLSLADPICQGPVPDETDPDRFDDLRSAFIASAYALDRDRVRQRLAEDRAALAKLDGYDRVVLDFGADWYHRSMLIRVLAVLAAQPDLRGRVYLAERDREVDDELFALGTEAWAALRSATPEPLAALAAADSARHGGTDVDRVLPGLAAGIRRHLAELPWTTDGLSLSERLCLRAVAGGAEAVEEIYRAHQDGDPQPYLREVMLRPVLDRLSPVLTRPDDLIAVLSGRMTWPGTARWVGGVELGVPPQWRWDPNEEQIVHVDGDESRRTA